MISRELCKKVLSVAVSTGADYAEIFAEHTLNHSINMISDKVDSVNDSVVAGAGIRVFKGLRSVSASTVDTTEAGLIKCAQRAADALGEGSAAISIELRERLFGDIHPIKTVPASVSNAEKVKILKDATLPRGIIRTSSSRSGERFLTSTTTFSSRTARGFTPKTGR